MCHSFSAFPRDSEGRVDPGDWQGGGGGGGGGGDSGDRRGVVIAAVWAELPMSLVDCAVV